VQLVRRSTRDVQDDYYDEDFSALSALDDQVDDFLLACADGNFHRERISCVAAQRTACNTLCNSNGSEATFTLNQTCLTASSEAPVRRQQRQFVLLGVAGRAAAHGEGGGGPDQRHQGGRHEEPAHEVSCACMATLAPLAMRCTPP